MAEKNPGSIPRNVSDAPDEKESPQSWDELLRRDRGKTRVRRVSVMSLVARRGGGRFTLQV